MRDDENWLRSLGEWSVANLIRNIAKGSPPHSSIQDFSLLGARNLACWEGSFTDANMNV